jgi:serine/threonine protein kinase
MAVYEPLFEGTPYRPIQRLRAGGMGEVFVVQHRDTHRVLVCKLIHERLSSDPRLVERLRVEAQALAMLQHEHVVKIVDFDATRSGRPFIVMELLEGRTLAEELSARGRLPVLEAVSFACQILSGLGAAHEIGVVHRDIKPDNLFVCQRPDGGRFIKVLDFGVARVMPGSSAVEPLPHDMRTRTGVVVGTPRFVSPEGAVGQHVDARADIYAVALVLYVMLCGRGPFDHFDDQMLLSAHAVEDPDPPSRFTDEPVPLELDQVVLKSLSKDPNGRFQTADEFRRHLVQVGELLRRPSGWLQTTAFDPGEFKEAHVGPEVLNRDRRNLPEPELRREPDSRLPGAAAQVREETSRHLAESPSAQGRSPLLGVAVFLIALLIVGLATVGLLSLLQGGGR